MAEKLNKDLVVLETAKSKLNNEIQLVTNLSTYQLINLSTVLIIGVFHGDEPQGKHLIEKYLSLFAYPPLEGHKFEQAKNEPCETACLMAGSKSLISGWGHKISQNMKLKAKELRNNATIHEKILWKYLKNSQMMGLKFRRQQPVGNYIADFLCFYPKIIIELDGSQHIETQEYDKKRNKYFSNLGYKIIRIWNNEITSNIESVLQHIQAEIQNPTPKSKISTLPQGEGRRSSLLFIPCLNPDGLALGTRTNANGVDLNRNFPTKNWGGGVNDNSDDCTQFQKGGLYYGGETPASEIETQFVINVIEKYKPKLILTLHAPYKIVNYDGPASDIAQKISDIIKYPVEPSIGYPTPGSFGTYCGVERNIPTITLELDEKIPVENLEQPVFEIFDMLSTS